jgi:hypothetical protein
MSNSSALNAAAADRHWWTPRRDLLLAGALTLPVSAAIALEPDHADGSVFMYVGQMWAHGALPYVRVFDNKPPGIFALIALAARINPSLWVVALIEFLFVLACIATLRAILQRLGAPKPVVFFGVLCASLTMNLRIYYAGNMPESYMLWPMTASMLAFFHAITSRKTRYVFVAGLCSGAASLFKPFGLSALMAQVLFTLLQDLPRRRLRAAGGSIVLNLVGATAAWIPALAYFWMHNGLKELLDASFLYNIHYGLASQPSLLRIPTMLAHRFLPLSTMVACVLLGAYYTHKRDSEISAAFKPIWTLVWLWFGFGLLLVLIAGRGYEQYFLSLVPALVLAAALVFWSIEEHLTRSELRHAIGALLVAPILLAYVPGLSPSVRFLAGHHHSAQPDELMVKEIQRLATPSSSLLVWGYAPWLLYATQLRSALRYPSTHYIYDSPRSYDQIGREILDGMRTTPPDFVVVSAADLEVFWPIRADPVKKQFGKLLSESYTEVTHVQSYGLYKHK